MISISTVLPFDCDRTCPAHDRKTAGLFVCRFDALIRAMGATATTHSHTARIAVNYTDAKRLRAAVEALSGTWLGQGTHKLYERSESGLGFTLPNWRYPLVLTPGAKGIAAQLAYDDFGGRWGNLADLAALKTECLFASARAAADAIGWLCEASESKLLVYHPSGGVLTLTASGECSTVGFQGGSCHAAREALGLKAADGSIIETAESCHSAAMVMESA